jgi:hypothetical protein
VTDTTTCYKSTMVIPMSLIKSRLDDRFVHNFISSNEVENILFGFLCFDHCNTNFFHDNIDYLFGYILADSLSLYLILQLSCTEYSSTYKQAIEILNSLS